MNAVEFSIAPPTSDEERILVVAPTDKDAALCRTILRDAGMSAMVCSDVRSVCDEVKIGAGAALLTEEAIMLPGIDALIAELQAQPAWSDLPMIVLTREGADSELALGLLRTLANVTLLERPVRVSTLVSALQSALRARRRQYQIRAHIEHNEQVAESLKREAQQKDEFLAMLAHELRNPLAPIMNALELWTPDVDVETARWANTLMKRQVNHIVHLVDDLMDISRIMRGRIQLQLESVEIASAIHHAIDEAKPILTTQQQHFTLSLPSEPIYVMADEHRLSQIVSNLLTNAAKYTNPGGKVELKAERCDGFVEVSVCDTGIGIAPEMLERIFEPFAQISASLDRSRGGLGIGLALVRRLVEMQGGTVKARSEGPGSGSEFVFRLPVVVQKPPKPTHAWTPTSMPTRRVLVVDDNLAAAITLGKMLTQFWGHEVAMAHDGPAAIEKAIAQRPDVALLDIGLPGLSGYEVAQRLRAMPEFADTLLIALTGYGQDEDRRHSLEAGFDDHLVKPVSVTMLEDVLRRERVHRG